MKNYSGNKDPFIYVAYDEKDRTEALKIIEQLGKKNKIYASSSLEEKEKKIMKKASLAVLILSEKSMPDMEKQVTCAADLKKELIPVYLDKFELNPGMRMILGTHQGVSRDKYEQEDQFITALTDSPVLSSLKVTSEQKKASRNTLVGVLTAAAVVVVALAAVLLFCVIKPFSGTKIEEDSTLGRLGLSGNADSIKTVYVYGSELLDSREKYGVQMINYAGDYDTTSVSLPGVKRVIPVGEITDVNDFVILRNLEELAIAGNKVEDLSPLWNLKKLKVLDISSNLADREAEFSIEGISALTELEELNLGYCNITSGFEELKNMPSLKVLYIDSDMNGERVAALGDVSFEIVWLDAKFSTWEEMKAASESDSIFFFYCGDPHGEGEITPTVIDIPEGEVLTVGEYQRTGGVGGTINNYGTIIIKGEWEFGLTEINNYGTIIVAENGRYICGMATTNNYGTFTVEENASQYIERGHMVFNYGGVYTNNGYLFIGFGGQLLAEGGRFVINGDFDYSYNQDWPINEKDIRNHEDLIEGSGTINPIPEEPPVFE